MQVILQAKNDLIKKIKSPEKRKLFMEEFDSTILTLTDDEGVEREFEQLDTIEEDGETYVALVPVLTDKEEFLESDGELVILKVIEENGEDILATIDDEEEFYKIVEIFEQRLSDEFEITN